MAATDKRRWIAIVIVAFVVVILAVWYLKPAGPSPDERRVRETIRDARSLYLTTIANTKSFPNERLFLDAERLAEKFQLKGRRSRKETDASVMVYLTETTGTTDEIVMLHPPDSVFVDRTLYAVDPGFWNELMRQAPQTKKWLEDVAPSLVEKGVSKPR